MCRAPGPRLPLHCKKAVSGLGHSSMVEDFSSKHQSLSSNANPETTPTNPSCRVPTRVSVITRTAKAGPFLSFCGPGNETGPCTCCPSALPLSDVYRHQKAFDHFADEETEAQSLLTCATQVTNEQTGFGLTAQAHQCPLALWLYLACLASQKDSSRVEMTCSIKNLGWTVAVR